MNARWILTIFGLIHDVWMAQQDQRQQHTQVSDADGLPVAWATNEADEGGCRFEAVS